MGLSYHFEFSAKASTPPCALKTFLIEVERTAQTLGFNPTAVVEGAFDTEDRRNFARRFARPLTIESEVLVGAEVGKDIAWASLPQSGVVRLAPEAGVLLVVTDERRCESVFGFYRYPQAIRTIDGRSFAGLVSDRWWSGSSIDSPDPRYRVLVGKFREAGYLVSEHDEFTAGQ